eukprot:108653-Amphidinium_carterae.2
MLVSLAFMYSVLACADVPEPSKSHAQTIGIMFCRPHGEFESADASCTSRRLPCLQLCALNSVHCEVHNLIAPNMTAMAKSFGFDAYERDAYIGGELTLCFYFPGVFGSLIAGVISGIADRRSFRVWGWVQISLLLKDLRLSRGSPKALEP